MKTRSNELPFDEDYIWMSYRYCIGRSTIAAHCHAETIARDAYGRLSDERSQFTSRDINKSIYDALHLNYWLDMHWFGNLSDADFRPLDVVYQCLSENNIDTFEKFKNIKTISVDYNHATHRLESCLYTYSDMDPYQPRIKSFYDMADLEIWQQLANLFDKNNHKKCRLNNDDECEYYECWKHYFDEERKLKFRKYKIPVDRLNIGILTYIPEENIKEDNINTNERN